MKIDARKWLSVFSLLSVSFVKAAPSKLEQLVADSIAQGNVHNYFEAQEPIFELAYNAVAALCAPGRTDECRASLRGELAKKSRDALSPALVRTYQESLAELKKNSVLVESIQKSREFASVVQYYQKHKISLDQIGLFVVKDAMFEGAKNILGYLLNFNILSKLTKVDVEIDLKPLAGFKVLSEKDRKLEVSVQFDVSSVDLSTQVLRNAFGFGYAIVVRESMREAAAKNPTHIGTAVVAHELRHAVDFRDQNKMMIADYEAQNEAKASGKMKKIAIQRLKLLSASPAMQAFFREKTDNTVIESGVRPASLENGVYRTLLRKVAENTMQSLGEALSWAMIHREPLYERRAYAEQARFIREVLDGRYSDFIKLLVQNEAGSFLTWEQLDNIVCLSPGAAYRLIDRQPIQGSLLKAVPNMSSYPDLVCDLAHEAWLGTFLH